jgi:putative FmdB family regulatory protein
MPLYDYSCNICNTTWEVICKIAERSDPHICPECSSTDTAQCVLAGPSIGDPVRMGITQKGNGFKNVLRKIHEKTAGSMLNVTTDSV